MPRPALGCGAQSTDKFYFRSSAGSHRWPPSFRSSTLTLDSLEKITSLHARRRGSKSADKQSVEPFKLSKPSQPRRFFYAIRPEYKEGLRCVSLISPATVTIGLLF